MMPRFFRKRYLEMLNEDVDLDPDFRPKKSIRVNTLSMDNCDAETLFKEKKIRYEKISFLDNGYYDMYQAMKALVDSAYTGAVHLDHSLDMVGSPYTYQAFATGYMKACLQRALAEAQQ